ncbi:MAG: hypothetical protein M1831_006381 [Alyxoria varia]|nr:MAG: hypothetical protein M1831_006381 [Alyxoria varia]
MLPSPNSAAASERWDLSNVVNTAHGAPWNAKENNKFCEVRREGDRLVLVVKTPRLDSVLMKGNHAPQDLTMNAEDGRKPFTNRDQHSAQKRMPGATRFSAAIHEMENEWDVPSTQPRRSSRATKRPVYAVSESFDDECMSYREQGPANAEPSQSCHQPCTFDGVDLADITPCTCSNCKEPHPFFKFLQIKSPVLADGAFNLARTCIDCRLTTYVGVTGFFTWRGGQKNDMNDPDLLEKWRRERSDHWRNTLASFQHACYIAKSEQLDSNDRSSIFKKVAKFHEERFENAYRLMGMQYEPESPDKLFASEVEQTPNPGKRPRMVRDADKSSTKKKKRNYNRQQVESSGEPPRQGTREDPIELNENEDTEIPTAPDYQDPAPHFELAESKRAATEQTSPEPSETEDEEDDQTMDRPNIEEREQERQNNRDESAECVDRYIGYQQHEGVAHGDEVLSDGEEFETEGSSNKGCDGVEQPVDENSEEGGYGENARPKNGNHQSYRPQNDNSEDENGENGISENDNPVNDNPDTDNAETDNPENGSRGSESSTHPHPEPNPERSQAPTSKTDMLRKVVDSVKEDPTQLANTTFRVFVEGFAEQCLKEGVGSIEDRYYHFMANSDLKRSLHNA